MTRLSIFVLVALLALCLASLAAVADDCGGHRCPPPEISTPAPTVVQVPWAPVSPLLVLPLVSK